MPLDWKDLIVLQPNEKIIFSTNAIANSFKDISKETYFRFDKGQEGYLVLTNKRFIFLTINPDNLLEAVSFSEIKHFNIFINSKKVGLFSPKQEIYILRGSPKETIEMAEYDGITHFLYEFLFKDQTSLENALKEVNKCFTLFKKENDKEKLKDKKIEVIHKGYVGMINFETITNSLKNKGLILQTLECPNCGGKVTFPKEENVSKCEHCGKNIYSIDIFDKFKSLIE